MLRFWLQEFIQRQNVEYMYKLDMKSMSSKKVWVLVSFINWHSFFCHQTKDHCETQLNKKLIDFLLEEKKYGVNICSNFNITIKQFLKPKYEKLHKMQKRKEKKKGLCLVPMIWNYIFQNTTSKKKKKNLRIVYQTAIIFKKLNQMDTKLEKTLKKEII